MNRQSIGRAHEKATALDRQLLVGNRSARLVTSADGMVTALIVGVSAGAADVPVRLVDEETLLIRGAHSRCPAEILIGVRPGRETAERVVNEVVRKSNVSSVRVNLNRADVCLTNVGQHRPIRG